MGKRGFKAFNTPGLRRVKQAAAMSELRGRRILSGLCPECGGEREQQEYTCCAACRQKARSRYHPKDGQCTG